MANRSPSKNAKLGLRHVQKLGALAVPGTLEKVPEGLEFKTDPSKLEIFDTDNWKSVESAVRAIFRKDLSLTEEGILFNLNQNVKSILRSRTGTFLCDCYREWLTKEMALLATKLKHLPDSNLLQHLEEVWDEFYKDTLPILEAALILLKPSGRLTVRSATLAAFRDIVFFAEDIESAVRHQRPFITPGIKHCILILQNVNDSYPPCKNRLRLESLTAWLFSPFMGYYGLYENGELVVMSNEPAAYARRRPSADVGPRRISRPFSVQPQQIDTLNQLFKSAIRPKTLKVIDGKTKSHPR